MRSSLSLAFAALSALASLASIGCSSTSTGRGLGDGGIGTDPFTGADAGSSNNHGVAYCSSIDDSCYCSYSASGGNGTACSTASIPSSLCCADIGWPDKNLTCSCRAYTCKLQNGSGSDSCQCGAYQSGNLTHCTDVVCCASTDTDTCHCGPAISCGSYETQVATCEASVAVCTGTSQQSVAACAQ